MSRSSVNHSDRNGVILIMVVVVIAILSLSSYGYTLLMQTENEAVVLSGDRIQARRRAEDAALRRQGQRKPTTWCQHVETGRSRCRVANASGR